MRQRALRYGHLFLMSEKELRAILDKGSEREFCSEYLRKLMDALEQHRSYEIMRHRLRKTTSNSAYQENRDD
jgi:hypothetical protein